jgi:hypothetical protein
LEKLPSTLPTNAAIEGVPCESDPDGCVTSAPSINVSHCVRFVPDCSSDSTKRWLSLPQRKIELHAQAEEVVFALAFSDFRLYFVFMQTNRLHAQQLVDHDLEGGVFLAILLIISIEQERCKIRLPSRALQLARVGWQCFELVFLVECVIVNRDALQSRIFV